MNNATLDGIDYSALTEAEESPTGKINSMRVYSGSNFFVTLRLTSLQGSEILEVEDDERGVQKRGIFIPFREAGLNVTSRKEVLVTCRMELAQVASSHHTHLLTQVVAPELIAEWRRLGFHQDFVGFARPIDNKKHKQYK